MIRAFLRKYIQSLLAEAPKEPTQMPRLPYVSVSVTIPAGVATKLSDLITAIEPDAAGTCRELNIQADVANSNSAANYILIGDSKTTSSRFGYALAPGDSRLYRSDFLNVLLGNLYVYDATASQILHVEIMGA